MRFFWVFLEAVLLVVKIVGKGIKTGDWGSRWQGRGYELKPKILSHGTAKKFERRWRTKRWGHHGTRDGAWGEEKSQEADIDRKQRTSGRPRSSLMLRKLEMRTEKDYWASWLGSCWSFFFFSPNNSFVERKFTYHTICPLKVYNLMFFSAFTELCSHQHNQF